MNRKGKYKKKAQAKLEKESRYFSYDYDKLDNVYFFRFSQRERSIDDVLERRHANDEK